MYINLFINQNFEVEKREHSKPYGIFPEFHKADTIDDNKTEDIALPCGAYLHTKNTVEGTIFLITKKIAE